MFYPYVTLADETEVVHSENKKGNGEYQVVVRFEKPDEVYGLYTKVKDLFIK